MSLLTPTVLLRKLTLAHASNQPSTAITSDETTPEAWLALQQPEKFLDEDSRQGFCKEKQDIENRFSSTSTHTDSSPVSGTVTDEDGNRSTISGTVETGTRTTDTSSVPYGVDYSVYILDIMVPHAKEGSTSRSFTRLHTFDQKGLYHTLYGIGYGKGKNPFVNVIDTAAKWLHENNLGR